MQRGLGRLVVGVVLATLVPVSMVAATVRTASALEPCEPTHPPAQIHALHALNVVPGTYEQGDSPAVTRQRFRLYADNPCDSSQSGCGMDATGCSAPTDTYLTVNGKRTAGSGALCRIAIRSSAPSYDFGLTSGRASYSGSWSWSDRDGQHQRVGGTPVLRNSCAGAYDVVVTLRNENQDKTLISGSNTYRQSHSFVVRRPARLSTNVMADTARVAASIPVRGRLTRTDWDKAGNPQAAYAGQRVYLQRATSTNGIYHNLRTVVTDRHGYLHTDVTALSGTRCYRTVFQVNRTTQRKVSEPDCVVAP